MFLAYDFIFDGVAGEQFNLKLYNYDSASQSDVVPLGVAPDVVEDRINRRISPIHYGVTMTKPLSFQIVFGSDTPLDRFDVSVVSSWLTGHNDYKWLDILQPDLRSIRYRCMIQNPNVVTIAGLPFALRCDVLCDSPYAYLYPETYTYNINGSGEAFIFNESSMNLPYYPDIVISNIASDQIELTNTLEPDRTFILSGLSGVNEIRINGETHIIEADNLRAVYAGCNFAFLRLYHGDNTITCTGTFTLSLECTFPISVGG